MECKIVNYFTGDGHKILTREAVPVALEDIQSGRVEQLIQDMSDTLHTKDYQGVGIAANQIGSDLAIFVIDVRPPRGF